MDHVLLMSAPVTRTDTMVGANHDVGNLAHSALAQIADANQSDAFLGIWLQQQRMKVPRPILLARFDQGEFSNERLEQLLDLGFDDAIIGTPTLSLIEKKCAKINGTILRESDRYGRLWLVGNILSRGRRKVKFTNKELALLQVLLEARGEKVPHEQLRVIHGYVAEATSHTIETHMYRIRQRLKSIGLENAIPTRSKGGYQLLL